MRLICAVTLGAVLALAGCSSDNGTTATPGAPVHNTLTSAQQAKVNKAATIAASIQASPDNADAILRQNGMTEQQFEDLMYEIAADPAMSEAYNARVGG